MALMTFTSSWEESFPVDGQTTPLPPASQRGWNMDNGCLSEKRKSRKRRAKVNKELEIIDVEQN